MGLGVSVGASVSVAVGVELGLGVSVGVEEGTLSTAGVSGSSGTGAVRPQATSVIINKEKMIILLSIEVCTPF